MNEADPFRFVPPGGEMGRLLRLHDWAATPLGPVAAWPSSLRSSLSICVGSRFPIALYWGPRATLVYNDAWSPILGSKHPWALGRDAREVWPEIWPTIGPQLEHVARERESIYLEDSLLPMRRHGYVEECYFNYTFTPVLGEGGAVDGVFNAVIETTWRVTGERRTRALRELGEALAGARSAREACARAADGLAAADRDVSFCAVYLADGGRARLVAARGVAPGSPLAPADAPLGDAQWPFAEAARRVVAVHELPGRFGVAPPGGAWPEAATQALVAPLSIGADRGAGFLVIGASPRRAVDDESVAFADRAAAHLSAAMSAAAALESERQRAESLAALDRAKTTFFSNVSHELRTPLTLMLGPLEEAAASPAIPEGERAPLAVAHRNALRLLKLVNALLEFSRIEAGRARASLERLDLGALTRDAASAFQAPMDRAGLRYVVRADDLGAAARVDRDMWETVVLNLVSNAFKFTLRGEVEVALSRAGDRARLAVRDTGAGIPADELPRLFERFHRVEGAGGRSHEGTGIGLSLVHELVKLHGGAVSVESDFGRGSTFTVELPLDPDPAAPDELAPRPGVPRATAFVEEALRWLPDAPAPAPARVGEARVLVADDNADMRDYLRRLLGDRWSVAAVADGRAALDAVRRDGADLVVADVMMPGLDGFELLARLRADPATRDLPMLMLSARAGDEARVEGLRAGADDYLVKPFSARELVARAHQLLSASRARAVERAHRDFLRALLAQAPVGVAVWRGPERALELVNEPYAALFGRPGEPRRAAPPGEDEAAIVERVYRTGGRFHRAEHEVAVVREDGRVEPAWVSLTVAPIDGAGAGEVTGVVAVAVDVTAQVLARRKVEHLRAAAESASRAKDEFLSVLSHELRTPLNAIIGWSAMLRAGTVAAPQVPQALETVERNARAQARLVEDMLDLARIEQGKLVLSVGPVELVRVVEAALDSLRPAAEARGVRLQPVLDSHATIVGDADRLQQVVWNLVSNAIKFTARGGRVQVRLRRQPSFVELAVADSGVGIDPGFLPHVFDRFRQADPSASRQTGGLGLGLAIVRSLVELHGGTVDAQSDGLGYGATFTVRLPTAPLRADQSPPAPPGGAAVPASRTFECPPALAGKSVLVVDDEHDTRELLRFVIRQCECRVDTAAGAEEALRALDAGAFDLVVSDIGMPGMDGLDLIRRVRAGHGTGAHRAVPALALSAYARVEDRTRALREGFDAHLAKPIDPGELLAVLAALVARRGGR
ncbi:MAG: ATP-binding protein [Polyangiales bacterium]